MNTITRSSFSMEDNKEKDILFEEKEKDDSKSILLLKNKNRSILVRLTLLFLFLHICFADLLLFYLTILCLKQQYQNNNIDPLLLHIAIRGMGFFFYLLSFLESKEVKTKIQKLLDFFGVQKLIDIYQNNLTVQSFNVYFLCQLFNILAHIGVYREKNRTLTQYLDPSEEILIEIFIISLIYNVFLYFTIVLHSFFYSRNNIEQDVIFIEDYLNNYKKSLIQQIFYNICNLCLMTYCFKNMNAIQIIILLIILAMLLIVNKKQYTHFLFLTFFNFIMDEQLIQDHHNNLNFLGLPQRYFQIQMKYLITLRVMQFTYIIIYIILDLIEVSWLSLLLILPAFELVFFIKIFYDNKQKIEQEDVEIQTKQAYQMFDEDFKLNPIRYKNLRKINIQNSIDLNQAFECIFHDFRNIEIQIQVLIQANINDSYKISLSRYNSNTNSQEIFVDCDNLFFFDEIIINKDDILPQITQIILLNCSLNFYKLYQFYLKMINCRTLIKITFKDFRRCNQKIEAIIDEYNKFYNCKKIQLLQNIVFSKHFSEYQLLNPQQFFFDLNEELLLQIDLS